MTSLESTILRAVPVRHPFGPTRGPNKSTEIPLFLADPPPPRQPGSRDRYLYPNPGTCLDPYGDV